MCARRLVRRVRLPGRAGARRRARLHGGVRRQRPDGPRPAARVPREGPGRPARRQRRRVRRHPRRGLLHPAADHRPPGLRRGRPPLRRTRPAPGPPPPHQGRAPPSCRPAWWSATAPRRPPPDGPASLVHQDGLALVAHHRIRCTTSRSRGRRRLSPTHGNPREAQPLSSREIPGPSGRGASSLSRRVTGFHRGLAAYPTIPEIREKTLERQRHSRHPAHLRRPRRGGPQGRAAHRRLPARAGRRHGRTAPGGRARPAARRRGARPGRTRVPRRQGARAGLGRGRERRAPPPLPRPARVHRPGAHPPAGAAAAGDRAARADHAGGRPAHAHRQGAARVDRRAAQGGQDVGAAGDRARPSPRTTRSAT